MKCSLCPRKCRVNRIDQLGACGAGYQPRVARAMLHLWEEPSISGTRGSGAVFFSGCNLGCIFCQNDALHDGTLGQEHTPEMLADLFLRLQSQGAHNINLVTPTPHIHSLRRALLLAKKSGLIVPVIYNTGSYETKNALRALDGLIDIYLPDLKYVSPILSRRFSNAEDYFCFASVAIMEMYRQVGDLQTDASGMATRGLMIRHLVLPGCIDDSRKVLDHIVDNYPSSTHLSLMRQYTPTPRVTQPPLNRTLTVREYDRIISYALGIGLTNLLIQQKESANLAYTPTFTDFQ
ncbi:MAG: radical SAM protein [Clostridia bacterium]